jgi:hypothetical protein
MEESVRGLSYELSQSSFGKDLFVIASGLLGMGLKKKGLPGLAWDFRLDE